MSSQDPPPPVVNNAQAAAGHNHFGRGPATGTEKPDPVAEHGSRGIVDPIRNESSGWLPATDLLPENNGNAHAASAANPPSPTGGGLGRSTSLGRSGSVSRRSLFTNNEGQPIEGSAFLTGAGTTGPGTTAEQNEEMELRAASAQASLTSKQRSKIAKAEAKDGKRLSKVIKQEAKVEKQALATAITELAELQKLQNVAIKNEAKAHTTHTKVFAEFQKHEAVFLAARSKFETAQAQLNAQDQNMEIVRNNARGATERLQEKAQEVDSLRTMLGVDERERAAKLAEITGKNEHSRFCW